MKINFEEARKIVADAKARGLIFDPLPCEASKKALKQKAIDDIVRNDSLIRAKQMSIRYLSSKLDRTTNEAERKVLLEDLYLRQKELQELEKNVKAS